jgi:hypothetical protein
MFFDVLDVASGTAPPARPRRVTSDPVAALPAPWAGGSPLWEQMVEFAHTVVCLAVGRDVVAAALPLDDTVRPLLEGFPR